MINCSLYPNLWVSVSAITCCNKSYLNLSWKSQCGPLTAFIHRTTSVATKTPKTRLSTLQRLQAQTVLHCCQVPGFSRCMLQCAGRISSCITSRAYRGEKEGIKGIHYLCHSYWATSSFLILKSRSEPCSNGSTRGCPAQGSLQLLSLSAWWQRPQLQLKVLSDAFKNSRDLSCYLF